MLNMDLREEGASRTDFIMFILIGYHVKTFILEEVDFLNEMKGSL